MMGRRWWTNSRPSPKRRVERASASGAPHARCVPRAEGFDARVSAAFAVLDHPKWISRYPISVAARSDPGVGAYDRITRVLPKSSNFAKAPMRNQQAPILHDEDAVADQRAGDLVVADALLEPNGKRPRRDHVVHVLRNVVR